MAIEVELTPLARASGRVQIHDVDLTAEQELEVGAELTVKDEGGQIYRAVVESSRPARFGKTHQLRLLDI